MIFTLMMRSRTDLFVTLSFLAIYLYSIKKTKVKISLLLKIGVALTLLLGVFFPLYQVFRLSREQLLMSMDQISFLDIVSLTIDNIGMFNDALDSSVSRSLGVFDALVKALSNTHYNGWIFTHCFANILPGNRPLNENVEYVIATDYTHAGADISDSLFLYGVADFGTVGIVLTILYYLFFIKVYSKMNYYFKRSLVGDLFLLYFSYKLFWIMLYVENSLYFSFHSIVYAVLLGCIVNLLIFKVTSPYGREIKL
jgi:hypothetical protein